MSVQQLNPNCPLGQDWKFEEAKGDYLKLLKKIFPDAQPQKTTISLLSTSVNRCFEFSITNKDGEVCEYILRYPIQLDARKRCDHDHSIVLERQVSILKWLAQHARLAKAPKVVHWDGSYNNEIAMPYMVLERFPGKPLSEVLHTMTYHQYIDLAAALGEFYEDMRAVRMPRAGHVSSARENPSLDNSDGLIAIHPFGVSQIEDYLLATISVRDPDVRIPPIIEEADLNTTDALSDAFFRRIISGIHRADPEGMDNHKLKHCQGIINKMAANGKFKGSSDRESFSLWHTDLFPRNIIVDLTQKRKHIISGIVDWDSPLFVPGFMACMPPAWLWAPKMYTDEVGDFIGVYGLEDVKPEGERGEQAKVAFDHFAGWLYQHVAYEKDYAIARIMMDYVQARDWRNHPLFEKRNEFIEKWITDDLKKSTKQRYIG